MTPARTIAEDRGLSPRVRGNRHGSLSAAHGAGSIPAGAGEPTRSRSSGPSGMVYPRGCGGTSTGPPRGGHVRGLSPRVRGNRRWCGRASRGEGSIPAGAGEPPRYRSGSAYARVYPRGCGGTHAGRWIGADTPGLSPRVRGNPRPRRGWRPSRRSIPAGAGEPRRRLLPPSLPRVYPRGCGGTLCTITPALSHMGLSPRVRGNRERRGLPHVAVGSIPAGAGEPGRRARGTPSPRVYPRGCGGTADGNRWGQYMQGLSPRVRGNRPRPLEAGRARGSIPAGAGEPITTAPPPRPRGVYPRGCGGTHHSSPRRRTERGLSPRVRGNPDHARVGVSRDRSIPAGAGEPCRTSPRSPTRRVYPRGCGGTRARVEAAPNPTGLSPRVRGNPKNGPLAFAWMWSIPAGAGEPGSDRGSMGARQVYPRGCGGTTTDPRHLWPIWGLSPRVRGNHEVVGALGVDRGSIPAGAGEPREPRVQVPGNRVYPRGCGGTGHPPRDPGPG